MGECFCTTCVPVPQKPKGGHWIPWNWSYRGCVPPCRCWECNLGPFEEQSVPLTPELSFQKDGLAFPECEHIQRPCVVLEDPSGKTYTHLLTPERGCNSTDQSSTYTSVAVGAAMGGLGAPIGSTGEGLLPRSRDDSKAGASMKSPPQPP